MYQLCNKWFKDLQLKLVLLIIQLSRMQQQPKPVEGFEESQNDHPNHTENQKNRQTNLYFKIPEAKPLLSKNYIDYSKPKVLIKEVKITKECPEVSNAIVSSHSISSDKPLMGRRQSPRLANSSLWKRFLASNNYRCLYIKYYNGKIEDLDRRTNKKLKNELLKMNRNNEYQMATYIVDLNFLSDAGTYFIRNLQENSLTEEKQYINEAFKNVEFDSKIECGNLMYAFQRYQANENDLLKQYYLILENDINTKGYANWFYFKICSKKAGKFKLNIMNLQKNYSFYAYGMRPVVFSLQNYLQSKVGWQHDTYNLKYHRNQLQKDDEGKVKYNTLSFTLQQTHQNDIIYIAAGVPYSYSKLVSFLDSIEKISKLNNNIYFRKETLSLSVSSNECPMLTITWKRDKKKEQNRTKKKIVIVIARQHPSEIVSSYVMEGFINYLVYLQQQHAVQLLRKYIFKIVPMVNIDGVIYGNSRCDISGSDANRKWTKNPNSFFYPIISAIKKMANNLTFQGYQIEYFIDLHGHSRKLGTFIYGCKSYDDVQTRMFSWIMSKVNSKFAYDNCRFGISNERRETARGCMMSMLANKRSMTLQTSFFGYKSINGVKPFQISDLRQIGASLAETIYIQTFKDSKLINWMTVRNDIKGTIQKQKPMIQDEDDDELSGSDSNPQVDQFTPKQKASTFISPTSAAKLGFDEVKIVQKLQNIEEEEVNKISLIDIQQPNDYLTQNFDTILNQKYMHSQILTKVEKVNTIKEVKSVTKSQPFKFKSLEKKSHSDKKIRIAIDIERVQVKEQKLPPSLPTVSKRNGKQFWHNLKKQCEFLINEKTNLLSMEKGRLKASTLFRKQTY